MSAAQLLCFAVSALLCAVCCLGRGKWARSAAACVSSVMSRESFLFASLWICRQTFFVAHLLSLGVVPRLFKFILFLGVFLLRA